MKERIGIGIIGYGRRTPGILERFLQMDDVDIIALCDKVPERCNDAFARIERTKRKDTPIVTDDYKELLKMDNIDAIINTAGWGDHTQIVIDTMEAGKAIGYEVGGAYSIEECWDIVRTQERTKMHCMMLENCCYGRTEMAMLNMVRQGIFGKVVHCDGGYCHDLRRSMIYYHETAQQYRLANYMHRNADTYPTHQLGPIMKILDINRGNKLLSVSSVASCSAGLNDVAQREYPEYPHLHHYPFVHGDVVTTTIKCVNGETITLRLDTALPRAYSRRFEVHGTKGMYMEDGNMIFLDAEHAEFAERPKELYNNADAYIEKYDHPLWQNMDKPDGDSAKEGMLNSGHGGTDYAVCRAFIDSVKYDLPTPIDVYDSVTMMCITVLSEESIAKGGAPVMVPDFTRGKYLTRKPLSLEDNKWNL